MSLSPYHTAVNQKLLFARQLLESVNPALKASTAEAQKNALAQSAVYQLERALFWHCLAIAEIYKVRDCSVIDGIVALADALAAIDKHPAEVQELQTLQEDVSSWLAQLLAARAGLEQMPEIRRAVMDADRLPVVAVSDNSETVLSLDYPDVQAISDKLHELVERQREMLVEF